MNAEKFPLKIAILSAFAFYGVYFWAAAYSVSATAWIIYLALPPVCLGISYLLSETKPKVSKVFLMTPLGLAGLVFVLLGLMFVASIALQIFNSLT